MQIDTTRIFDENFHTNKKININRWWTRSSKTYSLVQMFVFWLIYWKLGTRYRNRWVTTIVRKYWSNLKWTVQRDFEDVIDDMWVRWLIEINKSDRTYICWQRMVEFKGADDSQKIKGSKRNILYCNEANELEFKTDFFQLLVRTKDLVFIDFNPDDEDIWINTELEQKRAVTKWDVKTIVSTYKDNPFLEPQEIEEIENIKNIDPQLWEVYGKGWYGKITWLIFNNVDVIKNIPKNAKLLGYWMDFWYSKDPTTLIAWYLYNQELYLDELIRDTWLTNQDIANKFKELDIWKSEKIFWDSAEPKSIEEIYRYWYNIKWVKKWPDSINFWIGIMKQQKIHITERSLNLRKEFKKYKWSVDKNWNTKNKPIDEYNHWIDASRYLCMMTMQNRGKIISYFV